jgi:geranylgeranyl reductase family protein
MEPDVLVVGAGPAGAAISILLARQGYRVLLVDRATFPRDKACAEYLSPACTPLLAQLGVLDTVLKAAPQRLQGMRVIDYRGRSCWGRFVQDGQCLYGLALPRLVLDHLLVEQARREGVELRTGFWVRQPLLDGQRVCGVSGQQAQYRETVRAKLVIAADGVQSTLARRLGLIQRIRWLQHVAFVTHYAGIHPVRPWGEMFLIPSGYIGLAPVSNTVVNVSVVVRAARLAAAQTTSQVFFAQTVQAHPELRRRFAQARQVKNLLTTGPMAQRTVCPRHDGIMLIGDAAGFFDPFTGQGIYLALHSATLAAAVAHRALCSGTTSADALHSYCLAHREIFRDKYRLSALIQLGLRVPWLANRVIDRLARRPSLADMVVGVAGDFLSPRAVLSWRFAAQVLR